MASSKLIAALALSAGIAAIAAPTLLNARDKAGFGGRMGDMMMEDGFGGPMAGFDFAGADADGDGKITRDELTAYRQAHMSGVDTDGDGAVSVEELTNSMMVQMQAKVAARAKARVEAQDYNGDGKLTVDELIAPPVGLKMFDRLDKDGDGAVSAEELAAARDRMSRMRPHGKGHQGQMPAHGMQGQMMQGQMMPGQGNCAMPGMMPGQGMGSGQGMGQGMMPVAPLEPGQGDSETGN